MADALVIGYGNPLRCDDGLGWKAADALSEALDSTHVEFLTCHQLQPELADRIRDVTVVVFVDAAVGGPPGEIRCETVEPSAASIPTMHSLSPTALLTLCEKLYGTNPRAYALSITGQCFGHGDQLSSPVEDALPELLDRVHEILTDLVD